MNQSITLITGITGFIGSHIAEYLILNGIQVVGLKRKDSDVWRCEEFKDNIIWVDIDDEGFYIDGLKKYSFDTIVHCAWIGVESSFRDNWNKQSKNIPFLISLLDVALLVGAKKFIFLGSQAEYGNFIGKISEDHNTFSVNAYGSIKLACLEIVKTFCRTNGINWIWLRLFSLFGEKENRNWLIPSLIDSMLKNTQMDFTSGEQKYAYLYINDFTLMMEKIIKTSVESGVYNVSSNQARTIKSMVEEIRNHINPQFILNFGALKYRENQSMHMEGDITRLQSQIGEINFTDYNVAMHNTINYYLNK